MTDAIELVVYGDPMPKGSKTAVVRNGKATLLDARRGASRKAYASWSRAIADTARRTMKKALLDGPLAIDAVFYLRRPKTETRAQRARLWKTTKPDLDKLVRAALDPLAGIIIADDARVVRILAEKRFVYPQDGSLLADVELGPRVELRICRIQETL